MGRHEVAAVEIARRGRDASAGYRRDRGRTPIPCGPPPGLWLLL